MARRIACTRARTDPLPPPASRFARAPIDAPRRRAERAVHMHLAWNTMSEGPTGYTAYSHTGWGAEHGESEKRASWDAAIERRDGLRGRGVCTAPTLARSWKVALRGRAAIRGDRSPLTLARPWWSRVHASRAIDHS